MFKTSIATTSIILFITTLTLLSPVLCDDIAYPSQYGDDGGNSCVKKVRPLRREVYAEGRIIDITHRFTRDTPAGESNGIGQFLWLPLSMRNGSLYNFSIMKLPVHAGTHVDAPGHMFADYFDDGFDVDTLDLETLNGML